MHDLAHPPLTARSPCVEHPLEMPVEASQIDSRGGGGASLPARLQHGGFARLGGSRSRSRSRSRPRPRSRAIADLLHGGDNVGSDGDCILLEIGSVRHGDVGTRHALDGRVEVVEGLALVYARANLRADAARGPALLDSHEAAGLDDAVD